MKTLIHPFVLVLFIHFPQTVLALDKSFGRVLQHMKLRSSQETGDWSSSLLYGLAAVIVLLGMGFLSRALQRRRQVAAVQARRDQPRVELGQQAEALGFKLRERKILQKIATHLAPGSSQNLLGTPTGREFLVRNLEKRMRTQERELVRLRLLKEKLESMDNRAFIERHSVRLETDLPVWVAERKPISAVPDSEAEVEPVAGRLLDISETGAAVQADLEVERGDVVQVWSAEVSVWIPSTAAGVVSIEKMPAGQAPVLHLHFLDASPEGMQSALETLRQRPAARAADPEPAVDLPLRQEIKPRIEARGLAVSEALREHVQEHARRLGQVYPRLSGCTLTLEKQPHSLLVEWVAVVSHHALTATLHTDEENPFTAIDAACERLEKLLGQYSALALAR
jgi:ribosome-associated translation inhibitor RaiA